MDVTRWTPTRRRDLLDHCVPSSSAGGGGDQTHCGPEHRKGGPSTGISQNRMKRRCGETGHSVYRHLGFTHEFKLLPGSNCISCAMGMGWGPSRSERASESVGKLN